MYICAVDTLLLSIIMIVITICEYKTAKVYDFENPGYRTLGDHGSF